MPTIRRICVTVGGTISVGGYENTKREVRIEADLKADEDLTIAHTQLAGQAAELLANDVRLLVERQLDADWMQGSGSRQIAASVQQAPSFPFLTLLSPATAAVLVNDKVKLYASKPVEVTDPDEPQDIPFSDLPDDDAAEGTDADAEELAYEPVEGDETGAPDDDAIVIEDAEVAQEISADGWHGSHDPAGKSARGWDG